MSQGRQNLSTSENPAEVEYKKARVLMNAQELGYPVMWNGRKYYIQEFQRFPDPNGSGLKTAVYLAGNPDLIPAAEITIEEQPK